MKEEIKHAIEVVASHPKTAVGIASLANVNMWYTSYEPIAKVITSVLGIILVTVLIVKHVIDIKNTLNKKAITTQQSTRDKER
jgi:FtsH-binding integral membrane protein